MTLLSTHSRSARQGADADNLVDLLRQRADAQATKLAYVFLDDGEREGARLTYAELDRRARAIAARLRAEGVRGERALLLYPPGLSYIEAFFGCLYAGVVAVPAYPPTGRHFDRLRSIVLDSNPSIVLTTEAMRLRFEASDGLASSFAARWIATDEIDVDMAADWRSFAPSPEDIAFLQYTSGSTADPRGVMITHANLSSNQALIEESFVHGANSDLVGWLPLYHDMGLIGNVLQPMYVGATAYLMSPMAFLEKPLRWLKAIAKYGAQTSGGPNFAYDLCARKIKEDDKRDLDLSSWRIAFSGAEPVREQTLDRFARAFADCGFRREAFTACYGLAEATLVVTAPSCGRPLPIVEMDRTALESGRALRAATRRTLSFVGCGHVWPGYEVAIVDPDQSTRCGPGVVGEIWVAGPGVARGYWGKPEESARVFEATIAGEDDRPFLRTGDLGFFDNGDLFIAGRLKDLIIVAGRNVHAHDVEAAIELRVAGVRAGCAAAFSVAREEEEQLAVVVEPDRVTAASDAAAHAELICRIRRIVAEEVGLEPAHVVLARPGSVPKTSSGKLRRAECRRLLLDDQLPEIARWDRAAGNGVSDTANKDEAASRSTAFLRQTLSFIEPEQRAAVLRRFLLTSAAELLDIAPHELSDTSSFAEAGLSSIRAIELKHRIDAALDMDTPVALLLSDMSVTSAADAMLRLVDTPPTRMRAVDAGSVSSLSCSQRAMWTVHALDGASEAYNLHLALRFDTPIDIERLRLSINRVVERHQQLRTIYRRRPPHGDAEPVILADAPDVVQIENATHWSEAELRAALSAEARRAFDIESQAPLRVTLFRLAKDRCALLFVAHHIAVDQWSLVLLLRDLDAIYRDCGDVPREAPRYEAFVTEEADYLVSALADEDWTYWREQLDGPLPILELPQDARRVGPRDYRGGSAPLLLDRNTTQRLKAIAKREGVSLYSALLAVYFILLRRIGGQNDIIVGGAASGRLDRASAAVVGNCVNPVAIRAKIAPSERFIDVLRQVNEQVKGAILHQRFPFQLVVERLNPKRVENQWPIYQTWFVLQQAQGAAPSAAMLALGEELGAIDLLGVPAKPIALDDRVEMFDLKVMAAEHDEQLALSFQYGKQTLSRATVVSFAEKFARLVDALLDAPQMRIGDATLIDDGEQRAILAASTGDDLTADSMLLHDLLGPGVRAEDIAIVAEDGALSYGELDRRSNRIARLLRQRRIGPECAVGVRLDAGGEYVAAVFGILKAGAAFVPLDPAYPAERLRYMLADSQARAMISSRNLPRLDIECPEYFIEPVDLASISDQPVEAAAHPDNLAYIVYTSGSTGRAKGVMATHRNAVASLRARLRFYHAPVADFLLLSSLSFDSSFAGLFWTLACGGRLHLVSETMRRDPHALREVIEARKITHLLCLPSFHRELLAALGQTDGRSLVCCIVAGEACGTDVVERHMRRLATAALFNEYGPTECSVWCAAEQIDAQADLASGVSIGRAIAGARALVLDERGELAPLGVAGELSVGGAGVVRGYLGRADLTAEKFLPDPFGCAGERLYRTGDRARYRADGKLEFLGRVDEQVKIRGHRVEISEVEDALSRLPGLREAAVVATSESSGDKRLLAYVVGVEEVDPRSVKEAFRREAPDYMIPHFIVPLDRLPRLDNGKVDRKALPAPDLDALLEDRYVAPSSEAETIVCAIFAEILGLARVGAEDDFFDLGGDSIRAIQASSALRLRGFEATPRDFFQFPTAAAIATRMRSLDAAAASAGALAEPAAPFALAELSAADLGRLQAQHGDVVDIYPLTPMQEGMLFHAISETGTGLYLMQDRYEIKGALDVEAFAEAWRSVVERHDILRTSFDWSSEGRPHQIVHRAAPLSFETVDLRERNDSEQLVEIDRVLAAERVAGFDLIPTL